MAKKDTLKIEVVAGLDLGNGYVKGNIDNKIYAFPSSTAKLYNVGADVKLTDDEVPGFMADVLNQMDVSFSSPLIKDTVRRFFGERALTSGLTMEQYDVYSRQSKAEVDLSGVLALGSIAADVLTRYWENFHALPETVIEASVDFATALPIGEFKNHTALYKQKYLNNGRPHLVTFHNFGQPVVLEITFNHVYIANEGEAAQYGLMLGGDEFLDMIGKMAVENYPDDLEGVTGKELVMASNTLGVDIGEGTIDFAVFSNHKFNADASSTLTRGYGNVLESALERLQQDNQPFRSRKELSELLASQPSALNKRRWNTVNTVVQEEGARFAQDVRDNVSRVYSSVGSFIEVIFVYGGGATPLESALRPLLDELISGFGTDQFMPIIYLDSNYSRFLNEHGLYALASRLKG